MDKESKYYKAIQVLFDVAKQYGDASVKSDEEFETVYFAVKEKAKEQSKFVIDLLLAFMNEKRREYEAK